MIRYGALFCGAAYICRHLISALHEMKALEITLPGPPAPDAREGRNAGAGATTGQGEGQ